MGLFDADIILDSEALRKAREDTVRGHLWAAKRAVATVTKRYERRFEDATRSAAQGRLWRAWASDVAPGRGRIAKEPAGFIYVNGGERSRKAIEFLTDSGRIQAKDGGPTAIPLPAAGSRGRGRNLTPDEWQRITGQLLRLVIPRGRPAMLVASGTTNRRSGAYRPITRARTAADERRGFMRGEQDVPIFILLWPRDFNGRISKDAIMSGADRDLAAEYEREARQVRAAVTGVSDQLD